MHKNLDKAHRGENPSRYTEDFEGTGGGCGGVGGGGAEGGGKGGWTGRGEAEMLRLSNLCFRFEFFTEVGEAFNKPISIICDARLSFSGCVGFVFMIYRFVCFSVFNLDWSCNRVIGSFGR